MTTDPKAAALDRAAIAADRVRKARTALDQATSDRDQAIAKAQAAGATYPELAAATGLTRDRISQVLTSLRRARA